MDIDFGKVSELVSSDEEVLFSGCFSERVLRHDFSYGRSKRDKYIEYYNQFITNHRGFINMVRMHRSWDTDLIEKCKKCKNEASRLLDIVYEY